MGTVEQIAASDVAAFGAKTIFGSFFAIVLILVFYSLLRRKHNLKVPAFATIVGVITIGSLILFTLAVDAIISGEITL